MNIKILGAHSRESLNTKCISLLIDDTLAIDAGGLTSSLSFPAQQKIKAILLTHQHYDHIKDIPGIAQNFEFWGTTINIYSMQPVYNALTTHLLNGEITTKYLEQPQGNPTIKFTIIEPYQIERIEGYNVLAVKVNHTCPAFGYQITSPNGKALFFTGDTGPCLADCCEHISPKLLIIEASRPNGQEAYIKKFAHMTPNLLKQDLISFRKLKGYLPQVVAVHMNAFLEEEIKADIAAVAEDLNHPISVGYEGMELHL